MTGWMLSGLICFAIGRSLARPLLDRWFGEERFERIEATIERGGATLLLAMRLIPILPFSLVSYAAGAARVPDLALHLDDRGRLPADHRARRLLRHQARGPQPRPTRSSSARPPRCCVLLLAGHRIAAGSGLQPGAAASSSTRKLNAAGVAIDVAERVAGLDLQPVLAALEPADELRRAVAEAAAVDPAEEGRPRARRRRSGRPS